MVQTPQFQLVLGALCVLVCIVFWEKSQWTQPARSDLLHNLPQSAYHANLSTSDHSDPDASHSGCINAWSCQHTNAWFQGQEHRWPELEDLADTYCQLELSSEPEAAGTQLVPQPEPARQHFLHCGLKVRCTAVP